MTDAELYDLAFQASVDGASGVTDEEVAKLAAYVARYTDPTPLAECLERVAGERGGKPWKYGAFLFQGWIVVFSDGSTLFASRLGCDNPPTVTTAGELHRLLDAMGVERG